jgi:hypothetical protein
LVSIEAVISPAASTSTSRLLLLLGLRHDKLNIMLMLAHYLVMRARMTLVSEIIFNLWSIIFPV